MKPTPNETTLRFSAAAPGYSAAVDVQLRAAEGVMSLLGDAPAAKRILDMGCGTGLLTRHLAARYPSAEVHGVDISQAMIARAGNETPPDSRVEWHTRDAASFTDEKPFDLVASSSSLHWMGPLAPLFANTARLLTPRGRLVFSIMLDGTLGEMHTLRRRLAPSKEPSARLPGASEVLAALGAGGFRVEFHREESVRVSYASAHDMLQRLHRQGVTGGPVSRGQAPLTQRDLARLERSYNALFATPEGGVYSTFAILYCKAVQP
jgi:malonyl-CoA O-methyltransferase